MSENQMSNSDEIVTKRVSGTYCSVVGCHNSYYYLTQWRNSVCKTHAPERHSDCPCLIPYSLHRFPKHEEKRKNWMIALNRKDFFPSNASLVCSVHFIDGRPTTLNPNPVLNLGYERSMADAEILNDIQKIYVPFLKKIVDHCDKKGKSINNTGQEKLKRIKYMYEVFTEADDTEKISVFKGSREQLEELHKSYSLKRQKGKSKQDETATEDSMSGIAITKVEGNTESSSLDKLIPASQIKKEKEEQQKKQHNTASSFKNVLPVADNRTVARINPLPSNSPKQKEVASEQNGSDDCIFVCASCQFRTSDDSDFMKHARTDHRTDLSLWCKECGKCFSNAGVLVSHIKERNCQKEEMIYRCGVKGCTFETPSGQTFVHHLRHCHKGSPFIFCIHCQKIFTLPHCLILHMQNDCPYRDKNRLDPGGSKSVESAAGSSTPNDTTQGRPIQPKPTQTVTALKPATVSTPVAKTTSIPTPVKAASLAISVSKATTPTVTTTFRGRGRGRGRGRPSRALVTDSSSDSDPDDPSWKPDEGLNSQPLRRSARYAKKVCDAENPDIFDSELSSVTKRKCLSEQPGKSFLKCPCCDFSALYQSILNDHYVTNHKDSKRMACLVCHVKFENIQSFQEHFANHKQGNDKILEKESQDPTSDLNVVGRGTPQKDTRIPYQTAIHDKLHEELKIKTYEELKTYDDLKAMREELKLKHFFKCTFSNCSYTTDDKVFYIGHMENHLNVGGSLDSEKVMHCMYCLKEFFQATELAEHMLQKHGRRRFQCSICFYRAVGKAHVQLHIKSAHSAQKAQVFTSALHLPSDYNLQKEEDNESNTATTFPYVCAVKDCRFETYDPNEFKSHNNDMHKSMSVFVCHYCKVDFISFKRLMSHYHLHGINNYQCFYCVHGSETSEEILLHLTNVHADKSFRVHVRTADDNTKNKDMEIVPTRTMSKEAIAAAAANSSPDATLLAQPSVMYPAEVTFIAASFFCPLSQCTEKCGDINLYLQHLRMHSSINVPCPHCPKMVDDVMDFKQHLLCHGPELHACESCEYHSWKLSDVEAHITEVHPKQKVQSLTIRSCEQKNQLLQLSRFAVDDTLLEHGKEGSIFICPFCYYKSNDRQTMKNHIYLELDYKRFICNLCSEKCCSQKEVVGHYASMHDSGDIDCKIDSNPHIEVLVKQYLLHSTQNYAIASVDENSLSLAKTSPIFNFASNYQCVGCSLIFPKIAEWHQHIKSCLCKGYRPYTCNWCGGQVMDLWALKNHTFKLHVGSEARFTFVASELLEEQVGKKLQHARLEFLKPLVNVFLQKSDMKAKEFSKLELKYYQCGHCDFTDNFKNSIKGHSTSQHLKKAIKIEKKIKNLSLNIPRGKDGFGTNNIELPVSKKPTVQQYHCDTCSKKTFTLHELEAHLKEAHDKNCQKFTYFYLPDSNSNLFLEKDTQLFGCAYCSVTQENLFHLQRHCKNLHSDVPFKVRGFVSKFDIECPDCTMKLPTQEKIDQHMCLMHNTPTKPTAKRKGSPLPSNTPSKVPKIDSVCSLGESVKMEVELAGLGHCGYCGVRFQQFHDLRMHHSEKHTDRPISAVSIDGTVYADRKSELSKSCYGIPFVPVDFTKITVLIPQTDSQDVKLSVDYLNKLYAMSPKVHVYDILK